ncbi:MAG: end-binding protein Ku [Acidobacteriota bacterium]|jgi:DNA end-binding protein Ku|nr:end-binding protein Ku [Acidobacteriota bacterium]
MARAIWKGSITFGLVNIPVGLYSAETRDEISFKLLDQKTKSPIHYKRVSEESGKEVPWDQTVRGYEFAKGKYVIMSDEDLKRAAPEATQTIDIVDFVDLEDIDPLYFDKPYYLAPDSKGTKAYALLRETLRRTGKVGIAKVVIRTRQYLAAVVARGDSDVLTLELMRYAHELRDPSELDVPRGKSGVSDKELQMAERLVEGMVEAWDPEKYKDDYRRTLMKTIDERVEAGELEESSAPAPKPERPSAQVVDLMSLLKRSVEEGPAKKPAAKKSAKSAAKKPAARKPARKAAKKKAPAAKKRKSA